MKHFFSFIVLLLFTGLTFAQDAGTLKWTFDTGDFIFNAPAIGSDGTIYVASNDHYLYAINSDGSQKWKFDMGYGAYGAPAIGADGTIYIGTAGIGKLFAINPDGTKKWESERADGWIEDSPAIASDGTVVFGTSNQNFYGIKLDGSTRWTEVANSNDYSSPAIAADGTIYLGMEYGKFRAYNANGTLKWQIGIGAVESSPAIGADGTIYVGTKGHKLCAINPDGTKKWEFVTGAGIYASPVIGTDGTVYVGSSDAVFYAVNPDGTEKWHLATKGLVPFMHSDTPAIDSNGTIYVTGDDTTSATFKRYLYAINPDGQVKWMFYADAIQGTPTIADDGTIYVGSSNGTLYAIYGDSHGLANSPWPRFHHDNKGTGNVVSPTAIGQMNGALPQNFNVSQAYPNPFNPVTHIRFSLNKTAQVQVNVYNTAGQLVGRLMNAKKSAGNYEVSWDAADFGSGVYFIKVTANGHSQVRKALLVK